MARKSKKCMDCKGQFTPAKYNNSRRCTKCNREIIDAKIQAQRDWDKWVISRETQKMFDKHMKKRNKRAKEPKMPKEKSITQSDIDRALR